MVKRCAHGLCQTDSRRLEPGDFFVAFPKPNKDIDKCLTWIAACNRVGFTHLNVKKDTYICNKHFVGGCGPTADHPNPLKAEDPPQCPIGARIRKRIANCTSGEPGNAPVLPNVFVNNLATAQKGDLDTQTIFKSIQVPPTWCSMMFDNDLIFMKYSRKAKLEKTLKITENLKFSIIIREQELQDSHPFIKSYLYMPVLSVLVIAQILARLGEWYMCEGNSDPAFLKTPANGFDIKNTPDCQIVTNQQGVLQSLHHSNCLLISTHFRKRCSECSKLRARLQRRYHRSTKPKLETPNSYCNLRFMSSSQIKNYCKRLRNELSARKYRLERLQMKYRKLLMENGKDLKLDESSDSVGTSVEGDDDDDESLLEFETEYFSTINDEELVAMEEKHDATTEEASFNVLDGQDYIAEDGQDYIAVDGQDYIVEDGQDYLAVDGQDYIAVDGQDYIAVDVTDFNSISEAGFNKIEEG